MKTWWGSEGLLSTVEIFSDEIRMQFGPEKCAKVILRNICLKILKLSNYIKTEFTVLEDSKIYIKELMKDNAINHDINKEKIRK